MWKLSDQIGQLPIRKTEQESFRACNQLYSEAELRHDTDALCPMVTSTFILTFAEVVLATHLNAWSDIPEEIEGAIESVAVFGG